MQDLFDNWEEIPSAVREVVDAFTEDTTLDEMHDIQEQVEKLGYTFDCDFSGSAYGLRPIGVPLNEVEGFED